MLNNLFGGDNNNMLLIIILLFVLLGDNKGCGRPDCGRDCECGGGGGIFGGDNIIWILILFLFIGDIF